MLPESEGGVVDNACRVYGLTGLRVVDFSIVPMSVSAHATAPAYGLAERAYDLLLETPRLAGGSSANQLSATGVAGAAATRTASSVNNAAQTGTSNGSAGPAKVGAATLVGLVVGALVLSA
jgi:choline dehydrogenase